LAEFSLLDESQFFGTEFVSSRFFRGGQRYGPACA